MLTAEIISHNVKQTGTFSCVYDVAEAARKLNVSETTIRRAAKRAGVKRIKGRVVSAFLRFDAPRVDVVLPFAE